jgi:hypothetical protein
MFTKSGWQQLNVQDLDVQDFDVQDVIFDSESD